MPKGPRGEKRPAAAIGRAVMIGRIATREIEDERELSSAAADMGRKGVAARHPGNGRWHKRSAWSLEDVVTKIDERIPAPKPRGPYKKAQL